MQLLLNSFDVENEIATAVIYEYVIYLSYGDIIKAAKEYTVSEPSRRVAAKYRH